MIFDIDAERLHIKTEFPREVRTISHVWIPMSDGTRLAARIWLPADAESDPVPALLEYIPYRKNDLTAMRDSIRHPYFAGHGYASVRVDMRGSGDSEGLLFDEYLQQEQDDALEVIAWLAEQPWCSGAVGMFGKSWGGFNCLQVAALRPPALKAIITIDSTSDRYANDVHYMGGCLLASDMLWWASYMLPWNARPPDPAVVGDRWREMWLERLEANTPWVEIWLAHQRRDDYWKHGSVCEDYSAIQAATLIVGGWEDGYKSSAFALLEKLACPKQALIGPWAHEYPEVALPGPQIGFLQECLRWWDHWLKGADTGIMGEPPLRAFLRDAEPPATTSNLRPGRWVAEREWPSPRIHATRMYPAGGALQAGPPAEAASVLVPSVMTHGLYAGVWASFGGPGELPADQRPEDAVSTCFDTAPLDAGLDLLGVPSVTLTLSADKPLALVAVRLCDVWPDGASHLISYGVLNLTHRDSHEQPAPLEPGQQYTVTFDLEPLGYAVPAGHRLRLALSPTYWPRVWPSPEAVTLTLHTGVNSFVALPVREPGVHPEDEAVRFGPAEAAQPAERKFVDVPDVIPYSGTPFERIRQIDLDMVNGQSTLRIASDDGCLHFVGSGLEHFDRLDLDFTVRDGEPLSASHTVSHWSYIGRGDWKTWLQSDSDMEADSERFILRNRLMAFEGGEQVFERTWERTIPRDFI